MDDSSDPNRTLSDSDEVIEPVQAPIHPYLVDAKNICLAAYKEIMTIALEANTWVKSSPDIESLDRILQIYHKQPLPGMRVEQSVESAVIPIVPDLLLAIMFDMDKWSSALSHMVCRGSANVPPGVLQKLGDIDKEISMMTMVDAEFQLPTPFARRRIFRFLRMVRKVEDMWVIVDVSIDYFPNPSHFLAEQNSRRRPSGLILRRCEYNSEVIWIENVEVPECESQDGIYTRIINSNTAFCAKAWVSTLLWGLKRNYRRRLVTAKMNMSNEEHTRMRTLIESMKKDYLDIVRGTPDDTKWLAISKEDVRVMMYALENPLDSLGLINYIAVTSFRVQAEPITVFNFLMKKSVVLQHQDLGEPKELIKSVSGIDDSYCITLYEKVDGYTLQEASSNGFCSFIITTPMALIDIGSSIYGGECAEEVLKPTGFAIMADGSDASLVTIAVRDEIDVDDSSQAVEIMQKFISSVIREICEESSII